METEKVTAELNKRFEAPLPDYYRRRIVFWLDEEREFEDKLDDLELANAKIARMTGHNAFAVKKLLEQDDPCSNYVVYCPVRYATQEDDWLLNVRLYSEEYRTDLLSQWLEEMGIPSSTSMRKLMKGYRKFLGAKDRRAKVAATGKTINTPAQLHLAVMAAICGAKAAQPAAIVKAVLSDNAVYAELEGYGAKDAFWMMVAQACGYNDEQADLGDLTCHLFVTACTRTMRLEHLSGLERWISMERSEKREKIINTRHQSWCFDFVSDWLHAEDREKLRELAVSVEGELRLQDRFVQLSVAEMLDTECFPCIHVCVLQKLMEDIGRQIIDADAIDKAVEKRRTCAWYQAFAAFYEGVQQVAAMQRFFLEHAAGFHTVEARSVWKEYTTDYYRMDACYRRFHLRYADSLQCYQEPLNELFATVAQQVEGLYVHWFLEKLGECWTNACEDDLAQYGYLMEVPRQTNFYAEHVEHANESVVIIISDALRYEVAASLAEQLRRETQSKVELSAMQGVFPTITKFGMAALLPHKRLTVEEKPNGLAVLADGMPTDSNAREKVLQAANPRSVALSYKAVTGMSKDQLRALTAGMEVVYIYHDTIDAASHASDSMVFSACDTAISELQNLVRIVTNRMNRSNIIITSDHGFLYTFNPLRENSKVESFGGKDVEYGRRYAILRADAKPDYLIPVKFVDEASGLTAFAPRESMRIKMSGGGLNFVHGGVSLQELCVPLISYHHLRNNSKEYQKHRGKYDTKPVTVALLSAGRKVSNMIFGLNFYQKEAVGDNRSAQTYKLFFEDEYGKQVSDTQTIIADKTSDNNQERTFRVNFNLRQLKYSSTATYYLVIADEQGLALPQREAFHIDIAFAVDEFDFFS